MFVHNCSTDPLTCQRYGITGYPTLTAFRSLSWSAVESCSSSHSTYIRLDYHGPIVVSHTLTEWSLIWYSHWWLNRIVFVSEKRTKTPASETWQVSARGGCGFSGKRLCLFKKNLSPCFRSLRVGFFFFARARTSFVAPPTESMHAHSSLVARLSESMRARTSLVAPLSESVKQAKRECT